MTRLDAQVREILAGGDRDRAATTALQELGPEILGYLRAVLRDDTDASDAFSLFAEWLWRGLPDFQGHSSLRTWAYKVAWTAAARFARDPYRARKERLPTSAASRLAASICASTALVVAEDRAALQRLRDKLAPEERTLLVLRVDRELEWAEVAEVLAAEGEAPQPPALRKQFERLKEKLAQLARDEGLLG